MALNQGTVGVTNASDGSTPITQQFGQQADAFVSEYHGRYYSAAVRGNAFGINGALTTTTAAGNATFTGLIVGNPAGSGYNLEITKVFVMQGAALTAETEIGVMYGANTTTVSLTTIANRLAGGRASVARANAGQTLDAAFTSFIPFLGSGSGAITVPGIIPQSMVDFEGQLIIPPGYAIASYTSRVTTTALMFGFNWIETPILR